MNPYYQQNQDKLKKEMDGYLSPIAEELEKETGKDYPVLLEEIWACYAREMLENFPYIGGSKASGTRNLTGAFVFVAMGRVCRDYGVTLEDWGQLATLAYQRYFQKIPSSLRKLAGKLLQKPKLVNRLLKKKDTKNAANAAKNPGSFETETQPPTESYPICYHTRVCPLADFAKAQGLTEYMPYICNLDYVMFEALGVPFYREHTCADGDGFCDFKLKAGAPVVPAWPCHGADPKDPLK